MKRLTLILILALCLVPLGSSTGAGDPACDGTIDCVTVAQYDADVATMTKLFEQANSQLIKAEAQERVLRARLFAWKCRALQLQGKEC